MNKDCLVQIRMDKDEKDWLKKYAGKHRMRMSNVIRLLVKREQEREKTGADFMGELIAK